MLSARVCAVATILLLLPGCALFTAENSDQAGLSSGLPWSKRKSSSDANDAPTLSMVRLEASIVRRPVNDARVRRHVWEELDESGLMSPDVRQRLNENGFRVGVAGSTAPWALQSLAQEAVAANRPDDLRKIADPGNQVSVGTSFSLMLEGKSLLEVQGPLDSGKLPLNQISQLSGLRDRSNMKCVFEISVKELNEDWVLLNVLPQIHAGTETARLSIQGANDQLPVRQNVMPIYDQQFTVKLLTGEVAVIGYHESADWNLGRLFFLPDTGSAGSENLLMIRMAGIEELKGQSDPSFRLNTFGR
jgi:hypothetical protein